MIRIARFLIWTVVFLAILAALDQFMVRVPMKITGVQSVQRFYVDFRGRIQRLVLKTARSLPAGGAPTVESIIEKTETAPPRPAPVQPEARGPKFFYVDGQGELRFADSLDEVPERFRASIKRLDQ